MPTRTFRTFSGLKILILKPSSLGDVVQALPVLRLLKRAQPEARIDWWIDSQLAPLLEGDRDIHRLVPFERRRWRSVVHWPEAWRSVRRIRRERYDWVIDLQALARSGVLSWLAQGRLTVGLDDLREGASTFYDIRVPRPSPSTHAVDWYLEVLPRLGVPIDGGFEWMPPRPEVAATVEARWPAAGTDWIGVQPGARWINKRWPIESFAEVVRRVAEDFPQCRFAVFGAREDRFLAEVVCAAHPDRCVNLAGACSLAEMVEWIRRCRLMISNDTGPMHVAAALGRPVVALFGPTDPRRTGPYGQAHAVLQRPLPCSPCLSSRCRHPRPIECLRLIPAGEVRHAVQARFAEQRAAP